LNGLYLNIRGREREGIVEPGAQADALLSEIRQKLLDVRDPKDGSQVITRIDFASEAYQGRMRARGRMRWSVTTAAIARVENDSGGVSAGCARGQHKRVERRSLHGFYESSGGAVEQPEDRCAGSGIDGYCTHDFVGIGIAKTKDMMGQSVFQSR